ncbi:MAG TPA: repressor LexA [Clostridiales bacterium]|nr:repressor LexA [Clostridiales bacterium]
MTGQGQKRTTNMDYQAFERLLAANKTTVYRVAKETGISNSSFSDWKRGRSSPKADKLQKLADYFGVPVETLMGVEQPRTTSRTAALAESMVPVIGEIRAGSPIITEQTLMGHEVADIPNADDYFYLRVCGDSMKNIGMIDGSLVLFRKQQYAEEGQIVACLVGGESATVKRFHRRGKNIFLMPENPDYSPIQLSTVDFETGEARILGVACEIKIKL